MCLHLSASVIYFSALQLCCIMVLIPISLLLIACSILTSSWWTLDIVEYGQKWQFGLWGTHCRHDSNLNEVGQRSLDLQQRICDVRTALPNPENDRSQAFFVSIKKKKKPGTLRREVLARIETLQCWSACPCAVYLYAYRDS